MLATGVYGHELPKQHGAPIRLVTPWKYGFKGVKSIVNIEPDVPHPPRWLQNRETFYRAIGNTEPIPTLLYNGYAEYVAHLY